MPPSNAWYTVTISAETDALIVIVLLALHLDVKRSRVVSNQDARENARQPRCASSAFMSLTDSASWLATSSPEISTYRETVISAPGAGTHRNARTERTRVIRPLTRANAGWPQGACSFASWRRPRTLVLAEDAQAVPDDQLVLVEENRARHRWTLYFDSRCRSATAVSRLFLCNRSRSAPYDSDRITRSNWLR